jgi:hypothetical protein
LLAARRGDLPVIGAQARWSGHTVAVALVDQGSFDRKGHGVARSIPPWPESGVAAVGPDPEGQSHEPPYQLNRIVDTKIRVGRSL